MELESELFWGYAFLAIQSGEYSCFGTLNCKLTQFWKLFQLFLLLKSVKIAKDYFEDKKRSYWVILSGQDYCGLLTIGSKWSKIWFKPVVNRILEFKLNWKYSKIVG